MSSSHLSNHNKPGVLAAQASASHRAPRRLSCLLLLPLGLSLLGSGGCVTSEEGRRMQDQLDQLKQVSMKNAVGGAELASKVEQQSEELRKLLEEARRLTTNLADASQKAEKLQTDLMQVQGKFDDLQRQLDASQKAFTEYRAQSDTKLEQIGNALNPKTQPLPDNPEGLFAEAQKRLDARQWNDARRVLDAFVNRYPTDARAAKAQYLIGEAYLGESKHANAIAAFTKVIDNFPKAEDVETAMFKNGQSFYALKYCNEAKTYYQELLRRYPKTKYKNEATEQIKEVTKQAKNKALCQSS